MEVEQSKETTPNLHDEFERVVGKSINDIEQEIYELMSVISASDDSMLIKEAINDANSRLHKIKEAGFKIGYTVKTNVGDNRFIEFDAISAPSALNEKVWVNLVHPRKHLSRRMVERSKNASTRGRVLFPPSLHPGQVSFETPENILNTMDGTAFQIKRDYKSV